MVDAIISEIDTTTSYLPSRSLESIYLGGGTPSLLTDDDLARIMDRLRQHYTWEPSCEITLEANPDDITKRQVEQWVAHGVNRLSIGIQSFHEQDLKAMNRAHNSAEALRCVQVARDSGISELSIDLIYGSETTSDSVWRSNVETALSLDVDHISAYCLTIEEGTALASFVKRGMAAPLDEDKAYDQFHYLIDALDKAGYRHYEISNFAREGAYARHNTAYWQGKPYLGLGPSAHSYDGRDRRYNIANNAAYIKRIALGEPAYTLDQLSAVDRYHEYILTAIRTMWGVSTSIVADQHTDYLESFELAATVLVERGLLRLSDGRYTLSKEAQFIADQVTVSLMVD